MAKSQLKAGEYSLIGRPESGYSMKVLSALRYKGVAHRWTDRFSNNNLYQQHAKVQLIPLVFLPEGTAMQDSTPILELLDERHLEPSIHPADPARGDQALIDFLAAADCLKYLEADPVDGSRAA
jgi:glutathione S-transferase